jgi:hypothetical protein
MFNALLWFTLGSAVTLASCGLFFQACEAFGI